MNRHNFTPPRVLIAVGLPILVLLTVATYLPALGSGFYLDDFYNLHRLGRIESGGYGPYVFGGVAGPTGRPLTLLTFALQHESWPNHPAAFKTVNLALHLAAGFVLFAIVLRLGRYLDLGSMSGILSASVAGLWLLHPLHQWTVLYTIQRMTVLSALFVFLGLWGFLVGRRRCEQHRSLGGYVCMSLAVALGTLLATLSKENGILLPLLVLVTDLTLLRMAPRPGGYRLWRAVFLVLPSLLIGLYLLWQLPLAEQLFAGRPYSMYQKTLTEAVALLQYLKDVVFPHPGAFGFLHDDFPVSRGLLDPPYTLAAVAGVAGLLGAGWLLRHRHPAIAFAILWFFAGHLLESTHLNLEIYFVHRNYLPSAGLVFAIVWIFMDLARLARRRAVIVAGAFLYAALFVWVDLQNANLWRDPMLMAVEAVRTHPGSPSAVSNLGNRYLGVGDTDRALDLYERAEVRFPNAIYPPLKRMAIEACVRNEAAAESQWEALRDKAPRAEPGGFDILAELDTLIATIFDGECQSVDRPRLLELMETLATNPAFRREKGGLHQLAANLSLYDFEIQRAYRNLSAAVRASPTMDRRLQLLDLLLAMRKIAQAEDMLAELKRYLRRHPLSVFAYGARIESMEARLRDLTEGPPGHAGEARKGRP